MIHLLFSRSVLLLCIAFGHNMHEWIRSLLFSFFPVMQVWFSSVHCKGSFIGRLFIKVTKFSMFSLENDVSCRHVIVAFALLSYISCIPNLMRVLSHENMLNFVRWGFLCPLRRLCDFFLHSVNMMYCCYWFAFPEAFLHSQDKFCFIMVHEAFNVLLNLLCK